MDDHPLKNGARRTFRRSPFSADWSSRLAASMCHGLAVEIPLKYGKHSSFMNISKNFWGNKFLQHGELTSEPLALHHWMPTPTGLLSQLFCVLFGWREVLSDSGMALKRGHFPRCFAQGKQRIHITIGNRQKHYITQDLFHTLQ